MNLAETTAVLTKASVIDRRTFAEPDVRAWHEICGHVDVQTALDAVAWHYSREVRWIMPADVTAYARRFVRPARSRAIESGPPSWDRTPEQQAYVTSRAEELRRLLRDGRRSSIGSSEQPSERNA